MTVSAKQTLAAVLAVGVLVASLASAAPSPGIPRIGVLSLDFPNDSECLERLRRGLGDLGYVEGKTHVLEVRWAEDRSERLPSLAADLVRMKVDLIVSASAPAAVVVKAATTSIPVVLASSFYPVEAGVVASLARPGGNVTGVTHFTPELMAKRVQLLKEVLPRVGRIAVLRLPGALQDLVVRDIETAARHLGTPLQVIEVQRADDFPRAFELAVKGRAQAVMTTQGPLFWHHRAQLAELALRYRLPSLSGEPTAAEAGALMFYGPSTVEGCTQAVKYVDRILKGARPADLPVEQSTKITMVINLKTARALGLSIPQSILGRADKIIE